MIQYKLPGDRNYHERIYPDPSRLDPSTKLDTYEDVIAHFTKSSLDQDGIQIKDRSLRVSLGAGDSGYTISFKPMPHFTAEAEQFKEMHIAMLDESHAGLALAGADACKRTPAWNPMAGYPVNGSDGPSEWLPCLPLGMPIANHRAVILLHYPPIVSLRSAGYLNNNTLRRWKQLLSCVGIDQPSRYYGVIDINPIAAPGSGQSEYPNDYFPINLTSLFFDNDHEGHTYVRAMLDLMLNPPYNESNPYTLPLLVCGSPQYDPQAPGWFRTRYKDYLPKDERGIPKADVLQVGFINVNPNSPKKTPYMIANHMIAAGVIGHLTDDSHDNQRIQKYEAQDLVAATFLGLYAGGKKVDPADALKTACQRWFGAPDGNHDVKPPKSEDRLTICALAQVDKCFDFEKKAPRYSYEEAKVRCQQKGGPDYSPCFGCDPLPPTS